jgi:BlaI family penicillinase repressor
MPKAPSHADFGIFRVLWRCGPRTVREAHEALAKDTGSTSRLGPMQIMHEKSVLQRERYRSHAIEAAVRCERRESR